MPRAEVFFDDLDAIAGAAAEAAGLLRGLFERFEDVAKVVAQIKAVEERGDDVAHRAYDRMHRQFITPFERPQMFRLVSRVDDVLDNVEEIAALIQIYEIAAVEPEAVGLARELQGGAEALRDAVRGLRQVRNPEPLLAACRKVREHEHGADRVLRDGLARLLNRAKPDPLTALKWKELFGLLELGTDRCEQAANVVEGLLLEHA